MRLALALVAGVALALAANPARPDEPASSRLARVAARHSGAPPERGIEWKLSPLQQEIKAVMDSVQTVAEVLRRGAVDDDELAESLADLEHHGRLRVLQIQAAHAERKGLGALAQRIREDIARLRDEQPPAP